MVIILVNTHISFLCPHLSKKVRLVDRVRLVVPVPVKRNQVLENINKLEEDVIFKRSPTRSGSDISRQFPTVGECREMSENVGKCREMSGNVGK
jgi:hypothetical protein